MFTVQYVAVDGTHKTQDFNHSNRARLVTQIVPYQRPIVAIYEGSTPITREIAKRLREWPGTLGREARTFAHSTVPA